MMTSLRGGASMQERLLSLVSKFIGRRFACIAALAASFVVMNLQAQPDVRMRGHDGMKGIQADSVHGGYLPFEFKIVVANVGSAPAYDASVYMYMPVDCEFADSSSTQRVWLPSPLPVWKEGDTTLVVSWHFRGKRTYRDERRVLFCYRIGACDSSGAPLDSLDYFCSLTFPGLTPRLSTSILARDSLIVRQDGSTVEPNPFPVRLRIHNTGLASGILQLAAILWSPYHELSLDAGTPGRRFLDRDLLLKDSIDIVWLLHFQNVDTARTMQVFTEVYFENDRPKRDTHTVAIPAIRSTGMDDEFLRSVATPHLYPNTPNPFNNGTRIRYGLDRARSVRLTVFDSFGREVCVLVDGVQDAGAQTIDFRTGDLPSGVYLYRLTADSFSITRNMLIMR